MVIVVRNTDNNTLEIHLKNIALNKDYDIGGSHITVIWQCISITIPLAIKNKFNLCKDYMHAFLFCISFPELLMYAF